MSTTANYFDLQLSDFVEAISLVEGVDDVQVKVEDFNEGLGQISSYTVTWTGEGRKGTGKYGVELDFFAGGRCRMEQGHSICWNGQWEMADALEARGHEAVYWD